MSDYVGCFKDDQKTCHELVRENKDVEQNRQKTYYDLSTSGTQYEVGNIVMLFNPTITTCHPNKLQSFYSGPQVKREIINDLIFVNEDMKTEKQQQKVHYK